MSDIPFNIVLVEPLIPQNTGNIGRLCAATNSLLHLIEPLGFELDDRKIKRAGLDYWSEIKLTVHENWQSFLRQSGAQEEQLWLFSRHVSKSYYDIPYHPGDYLIFGNEGPGLAEELHCCYSERRYRIPMENAKVRSLNLANSASIVLYEARRQQAAITNKAFGG